MLSGLNSPPPKACSCGGGGRSGIVGGLWGIGSLSKSLSLDSARCFFFSFAPETLLDGAGRSVDLVRRRKLKDGRRRGVTVDSVRLGSEGSSGEKDLSESRRCQDGGVESIVG